GWLGERDPRGRDLALRSPPRDHRKPSAAGADTEAHDVRLLLAPVVQLPVHVALSSAERAVRHALEQQLEAVEALGCEQHARLAVLAAEAERGVFDARARSLVLDHHGARARVR